MEPDNNSPGQNGPTGGNTPPPPIEDQPQVVYMTRPIEPRRQTISEDVKKRHEESRRTYPFLNISEGEYVIFAIKRHPIGLVYVWGSVGFVILAAFALIMVLAAGGNAVSSMSGVTLSPTILLIPAVLISLLATIFGFISAYIYNANRFYLTNESVIQHIQTGLFNRREQTISLANIEDASYSQDGILPHVFNYGQLRLSTQGDETTYRFNYASNPIRQIAVLNNAVEDFKNIRPIE
jgi:hypothetical protein